VVGYAQFFYAKSLLQSLWTLGLKWDDNLPSQISIKWNEFVNELPSIADITLRRPVITSQASILQLHGFSDASEKGYAAVVYLRLIDLKGDITVSLLIAKSRVAPLKRITLPRLELCGAHLLAKLLDYCYSLFSPTYRIESISAWSDSTIALSWIQSTPHRLKTFVANRVSEIQHWIPPHQWHHVASCHNPADCASRGVMPSQLKSHPLWWCGPKWLSLSSDQWPNSTYRPVTDETQLELRPSPVQAFLSTRPAEWDLLLKFSSLFKFLCIVAYMRRFIFNSRPLTPLSSDPSEVSALTPGHFLIGESLISLPMEDHSNIPLNRLNRWKIVQSHFQKIWKRWHREYLHTLQQRQKWTLVGDGLKPGDLVLVHEPNTIPLLWCLARVKSTFPGKDGVVRVVHLRTAKGTLTRPAVKVFPLPIENPSQIPV
jgi:hypothetical protein